MSIFSERVTTATRDKFGDYTVFYAKTEHGECKKCFHLINNIFSQLGKLDAISGEISWNNKCTFPYSKELSLRNKSAALEYSKPLNSSISLCDASSTFSLESTRLPNQRHNFRVLHYMTSS